MNAAPSNVPALTPGTAAASVTASQIATRSVMGGVIAGAAVAVAGGKQEDVENAITRGAMAVLIREGYRELTTHELNEKNLQASVGDAYCLKVDPTPDPTLACLPPQSAYIKDENQSIKFDIDKRTGIRVPQVDLRKLDENRPHVGMWASEAKGPFLGGHESNGVMKLVSRLPGWNAMSVAHDQFDAVTNPGTGTAIDLIYQVGTIAPFVVITYEGAGGGVKDMIRSVATTRPPVAGQSASAQGPAQLQTNGRSTVAASSSTQEAQSGPTEITHVVCRKAKVEKHFVMQIALTKDGTVDEMGRVCRIDEGLGDVVHPLWHAHFQDHSCVSQLNRMIKSQLAQKHQCAASVGLRQTDIRLKATN
jgi:hypothetical protein